MTTIRNRPDEIDEILFHTAMCQGKILQTLRQNRSGWSHTRQDLEPNDHKPSQYNYDSVKSAFKKNPNLSAFSDEFYTRLDNAPPYTVHQFYTLFFGFKMPQKLSLEQLQDLYEATRSICDDIMLFIHQIEIIADMLHNIPNIPESQYDSHLRKRQDKYFSGIKTSLNTLFMTLSKFSRSKLLDILNLGDKFVFVNNTTRNGIDQHIDYPYQNWIHNIAELWLSYARCYLNMFEKMIELENSGPSIATFYDDGPIAEASILPKSYILQPGEYRRFIPSATRIAGGIRRRNVFRKKRRTNKKNRTFRRRRNNKK